MTSLEGARCVGLSDLFDSTDPIDHRAAKYLCKDCPAIDACRIRLRRAQRAAAWGAGPQGTWAGRCYGTTPRGEAA